MLSCILIANIPVLHIVVVMKSTIRDRLV